jgi:5S rRNA maturation endonuclease (ribonuclease M5)
MQLYNIEYRDALEKIAADFGITDEVKYKEVIEKLPPAEVIKPKKAPKIIVSTRTFTTQELKYWEEYDQGLEDLKRENIYAPKEIWVNNEKKILIKDEFTFCYYYPEIDRWKIYKPFAKKEFKWFSNVPFDYIENIKNVENCKKVLIAKSKKDKMVLQKALNYDCMITSQAEDLSCFNEESIRILKTCKSVYTVFDNDTKGKSASWTLTNNFAFKHCNVPDKYLVEGITDFADLFRIYGSYRVREQFVKKKII